jgi:hypothetical protein
MFKSMAEDRALFQRLILAQDEVRKVYCVEKDKELSEKLRKIDKQLTEAINEFGKRLETLTNEET